MGPIYAPTERSVGCGWVITSCPGGPRRSACPLQANIRRVSGCAAPLAVGMERYAGRVALVTGASSGIGAAITQALLRRGLKVVGLARRVDMVKALVLKDAPGTLYPLQGDVSSEESILCTFNWVKENLGGVDVLINKAGVCRESLPSPGQTAEWKRILDVNVLGLSICTREAVQGMLDRGVDDGFIIHICSIFGHIMPLDPLYSMYHASKHAVKTLLEGLRKDLVARNSKIRCGVCDIILHPTGDLLI
ncbi:dehydrogenase/reductase SDR family member 11-like isoform X2 [Schistocerca gregaria]|uniref:dehydrogenase/reductase SDR family member 11-like isoform X2 n=1 Tax=Schistocerca gregaria TaxID=7010 RepID=UPI00211E09F7|nr:dehydrogenase/reductase SDR family member 11-like isoform X2 [Schistocerca gregaria]